MAPFVVFFIACFIATLAASRAFGSPARAVVYNLAFIFLALALFEAWLEIEARIEARRAALVPTVQAAIPAAAPQTTREGSYLDRFLADDPELGYRILPAQRNLRSILKRADGTLIYDVEYSLDRNGMRQAKPAGPGTVYFFGDSFTFGEGVDDEQTLPAVFSEISGLYCLNFAAPGYGPHQTLRQLELNVPQAVGAPRPSIAIYTLLTGHIDRAAGRSPWDTHGPHYEPAGDDAEYVGPYVPKAAAAQSLSPPAPSLAVRLVQRALASWRTYQLVVARLHERSIAAERDADRARLAAILMKSRKLLRERYNTELVIVLWDTIPSNGEADAAWIAAKLEEERFPLLRISEALPELRAESYYLAGDGHPRGAAYELVAKALLPMVQSLAH